MPKTRAIFGLMWLNFLSVKVTSVGGRWIEFDTSRRGFTEVKYVTISYRFMSSRQSNAVEAIRVNGFAVL